MPVAAVGAAALAGALALSVGSAAVGDGIVRFGMEPAQKSTTRRGRNSSLPLTPSTRAGMPFGGEVLVPGAPFQPENGYLGMWCVSRVESVIERSHVYFRAGTGRRQARAPCPRTRRRRRRRR